MSLLGDYRPGQTWLHRLPAGAKLLGVLLAGVVVVVVRGPVSAVVALGVALLLVLWAGAGERHVWRATARAVRGVLVVAAVLGAWQAWQRGWPAAVESVGDLLALVLVATVLTLTTPVDALLDALVAALRPPARVLDRLPGLLRLDPDRVALAFALMIRAVPTTLELAEETRQAAMARGVERSPRARLVPLVIRVVARAHETGDALHARGVD